MAGGIGADEALLLKTDEVLSACRLQCLFHQIVVLGVAVLNELVRRATALLKDNYDMELVETHHNEKKDAPSGTAKTLLSIMNESGEFTPVYGRQGDVGARGKEIGVHSLRGGTEAGEHTVHYFGNNETITISHRATNRVIFVNGALKAADYLIKQSAGMYGMKDLIG